ncbi:hypothetical protein PHLGIDRAFT_30306 [Phlebiopsis gigantea 11061_1 CR5-6]|uniref:tRNA-splicing endonuclease subunit Sen54 N-terminal domain-containing protein n=1 Tax=Phlebiopsis gigantea (strain 11061_1 CR5-6) TaxID=745531 RepID=A0A0C3NP16_PHLG1|nr:hypothetical protein PHLGIDRAFT_30306 [Phlebiopsis gigantea 11061_1 CR5-6]
MDDNLEHPHASSKPSLAQDRPPEDDEQSSADEDEGPDWTKLPTVARPIIPKRGEKDFEPKTSGGSGLQRHVLDRARSAMADALRATRTTSSKTISYAVWHPDIARANVTVARGIHFTTMGHSVARASAPGKNDDVKTAKRLELLPEEALYLVERGAMFCWKEIDLYEDPNLEGMDGAPMSVQQAFAEMIGKEDLTLEKYHVYAYLRRLGYVVTRTQPPSDAYPVAAPFKMPPVPRSSIWARCFAVLLSPFRRLLTMLRRRDWWRPVYLGRRLHHNLNNPSLFRALRFLPSGNDAPFRIKRKEEDSPYQIFYNLYKPSTPFKKTSPPAPDFSLVVVNARTTPMPTLAELHDLFEILPEVAPPGPRRRTAQPNKPVPPIEKPQPAANLPLFRRLFSWAYSGVLTPAPTPPRRPNPFAVLKQGKKMVVIAAVDAGTISFFRFGQGAFEDFPMN